MRDVTPRSTLSPRAQLRLAARDRLGHGDDLRAPGDVGWGAGWEAERGDERIVVVSNRGPVEHSRAADGSLVARRGAGGVVSGLLCALGRRQATWISLAMTEGDRAFAASGGQAESQAESQVTNEDGAEDDALDRLDLRLVDVPADTYRRHYEGISNRVLWFAQHYLLSPTSRQLASPRTLRDWRDGYIRVNEAVAEAVLAELRARPNAPVLFQDYHLYLAPAYVRAARPDARLTQFVHIPWPEPRYWELLPEEMAQAIFHGLAANDVIGFQTERDAQNFCDGAVRFLGSSCERRGAGTGATHVVLYGGRRLLVRVYPIAVCSEEVRAAAESPEARQCSVELWDELGLDDMHRLILRVDRVDPTKNIERGFEAYERLLRDHKDYHGRVTFLALLVPTRENMAEYRACERRVRAAIARVNKRFGRPGWQPIVAIFGNDRARALACMRRYDVLLVNPLLDGMNLVVKEGALLNKRGGVVVLSRTAGAYEQLRGAVLGVAPVDVEATAEQMHRALTMPADDRATLAWTLQQRLRHDDARAWLDAQLADLTRHRVAPHPAAVGSDLPRLDARPSERLDTSVDKRLDARDGRDRVVPVHPVASALLDWQPTEDASAIAPCLPDDEALVLG